MSEFYPDRRAVEHFKWALIDASAREELPAHWPTTVVAPAFLGGDTDRCPALLNLRTLPDDERTEWCDALHHEVLDVQETRASLLLAADASAEAIAAHLAQRMVLRLPDHDRPMQWRFFDPGTCLQMPRVLGAAGMAWLMGPASAFMVPWMGEWTLMARPSPSAEAPESAIRRFTLGPDHLAALSRLGVVNRVLMHGEAIPDAATWVDQARMLDAVVLEGQSHQIYDRDDLLAYALHARDVHPRIHQHPHMQNLLTRLQHAHPDDELDYRELTAAIEPKDWMTMAAELQTTSDQEETHP